MVRSSVLFVLLFLISFVLLLYIVFPFFWLVISSFKYPIDLYTRPPTILPNILTIHGYLSVLRSPEFQMAFKNTALIAACTTISTMFLAVIASYAVIRLRFRFNRRIFVSVFLTQFVPPFVIIIPLYFVMNGLKLLGTYQGVIFAQMTFALPYAIWLLYGYFVTFPYELEEAAWIDGCSRLQAIIKIILPLSGPGLIATGIFVFVGAWNDLLYTLIIGAGRIKTIPVKLAEYIGEARIVYELMFPAAVISTIPILLVGLIFQKYIVKGIAEGALRT